MNISQLECFTTLAETLNYQKTADSVGLTQPAVSKQIQALEAEVGARLFHRTTRSVTLTQIGLEFLPEAREILNTWYHSMEKISRFHTEARHALRIGYMDPNTVHLIGRILGKVLLQYPNLVPELYKDQTDANLQALSSGKLDLVISIRDANFNDDNIVFTKLHNEAFMCVMPENHELAEKLEKEGRSDVNSSELWNYRQIVAIPQYLLKNHFSRGRTIVPVNDNLPNAICSDTNEAYSLLEAGFGYAFIPEHEIVNTPGLKVFKWNDSPHALLGIYRRKETVKDKETALQCFVKTASGEYL